MDEKEKIILQAQCATFAAMLKHKKKLTEVKNFFTSSQFKKGKENTNETPKLLFDLAKYWKEFIEYKVRNGILLKHQEAMNHTACKYLSFFY